MIPTISKPTRLTRHTVTATDHVFTNTIMGNIEIKAAIVKTDILDHFPIIFATKNKIDAEITEQYIFKRNTSDQSIGKFKQKLRHIDWNNIKILRNVNDAFSKFLEIFLSLYNEFFPKIQVKLKPQRQFNPWITKGIRKSSKKKQKLYENFLKKRTKQSETEYKVYKNMLESIKHKSKKSCYSQKIIEYKDNAKKTWNVMKELIGKTRKSESHLPGKLLVNEQEVSGKVEITNEFNTFFTNIGAELAKNIPNASRLFESYINRVDTTMPTDSLTINEVKEAFFSLKINKSPGSDEISFNVIKNCFSELNMPLKYLFDMSLESGIFPEKLKLARVIPLYKAADPANIRNYRPISVLP